MILWCCLYKMIIVSDQGKSIVTLESTVKCFECMEVTITTVKKKPAYTIIILTKYHQLCKKSGSLILNWVDKTGIP